MKEKALVMEINDQNVIMLTSDGKFISRRISGLCPQIGEEIEITEEKQTRRWLPMSLVVAAAVLIAVFFAGKLWSLTINPSLVTGVVTYVTVDINPSVELGLDKRGYVVYVEPLNDDGSKLLEKLDVNGNKAEDAVEIIVRAAADQGYLAPEKGNRIIINVSEKNLNESQNKEFYTELPKKSQKTLSNRKMDVKIDVIKTDLNLRKQAQELGISAGKYAMLLEAAEAGLKIEAGSIRKSGVVKAIKNAGGDPEEIIKRAKKEKAYSEKIKKWRKQLKDMDESTNMDNNKHIKDSKDSEKEKPKKIKEQSSGILNSAYELLEINRNKEDIEEMKENNTDQSKDQNKEQSIDQNNGQHRDVDKDNNQVKDNDQAEDNDKDKVKDKNKDKDKDKGKDKANGKKEE